MKQFRKSCSIFPSLLLFLFLGMNWSKPLATIQGKDSF